MQNDTAEKFLILFEQDWLIVFHPLGWAAHLIEFQVYLDKDEFVSEQRVKRLQIQIGETQTSFQDFVKFLKFHNLLAHLVTLEDVEFIFEFEILIHQPQSKTSLCSKVIPHDSVDAFRDFEFIFELYSRLLSTLEFLVHFINILSRPKHYFCVRLTKYYLDSKLANCIHKLKYIILKLQNITMSYSTGK